MKITNSLVFKIAAGVIALVIIGTTILSSILLNETKENKINSLENQLISDSQKLGDKIDLYLNERLKDITELSSNSIVSSNNYNYEEKSLYLEKFIESSNELYSSAYVVDLEANILASTKNANPIINQDTNTLNDTYTKNKNYIELNKSLSDGLSITISSGIKDENNSLIGVLFMDMDLDEINKIMNKNIDDMKYLGWEGSYNLIIDKEGLVLWHPKKEYIGNLNLLNNEPSLAEAAKNMIDGKTGSKFYNFENEDRMIAYSPMDGYDSYKGLGWSFGIVSSRESIYDQINIIRNKMLYSGIGLVIVICAFIFMFLSLALKPLKHITQLLKDISEGNGDLTKRIDIKSKDEIGEMAEYFNDFINKIRGIVFELISNTGKLNTSVSDLLIISENMNKSSNDMTDRTCTVSASVEEIAAIIEETATATNESSSSISNVASSVEEMTSSIKTLAVASEEISSEVNNITSLIEDINNKIARILDTSKDADKSVNSVATAIKEINLSLNDISQNCERSILITDDADEKATFTSENFEKLNKSSKQIGKVVKLINDIADQINMLALNAAIEAAGAGEVGKGFAVVANEVKILARHTAEATDEIEQQIEEMQVNMKGANESFENITSVITEIKDITNSIAAAVTEQSSITGEIAVAIYDSSQKVNYISSDIETISIQTSGILRSSLETGKGVNEIARSATELSIAANEISDNITLVSQGVTAIAKSSEEISKGANEISENIVDINLASEENFNISENTLSTSNAISDIADSILVTIEQFKVE